MALLGLTPYTTALAVVAASLLAGYLYRKIRHERFNLYQGIVRPNTHPLWGHLKLLGEYKAKSPKDIQLDNIMEEMSQNMGNPSMFYIDLRPVMVPMIMIGSHKVAEQISRATRSMPYSAPKSTTLTFLHHLIGDRTILELNGDNWKGVRKQYNAAFSRKNLIQSLPLILDKTKMFLDVLNQHSDSGSEFALHVPTVNVSMDIIGAVTMGYDFNAQLEDEHRTSLFTTIMQLIKTYDGDNGIIPPWLRPGLHLQRTILAKSMNRMLSKHIRARFSSVTPEDQSVLALSFKNVDSLTPNDMENTLSQIKTFLFAGHDTTAVVLQWTLYLVYNSPGVLAKLRQELDDLFGPDCLGFDAMRQQFVNRGDELLGKMTYMSAVIKETMRLYPPGSSARYCSKDSGFTIRVPETGKEVCVDGALLFICHHMIQRDPFVYGETANDFLPDRWLNNHASNTEDGDEDFSEDSTRPVGNSDESSSGQGIPVAAWRAFERGPRNCIGQELANLELKVILACILRRYDITKQGLGAAKLDESGKPVVGSNGSYETESVLYSKRTVSSKPIDGMLVKIKYSSRLAFDLNDLLGEGRKQWLAL